MSVFGNSAFGKPASTPAFGTAFGSTNANTNTIGQTPQQPTTSAFGGFGQANQAQNQQQQQQQQQQIGAAPGTSLVPGTGTTANPLFGGKPAASLFGSTNTTTQPAVGAGSTSLFGNPTAQNATGTSAFGSTPNTAGTGLFGSTNTSTTQPSTGLFGSTNPSTTTQPSTGLFGSANTSNPTQPSTGLFGQPNNTATVTQPTTNLFGSSTNTSTTTQPTTGLFGQPQNQQPSTTFFGQPANPLKPFQPTTSLFGQQSQPQQPSLFGGLGQSTPAAPATSTSSLFGSSQTGTSMFGLPNTSTTTSSIFAPKSSLIQTQSQSENAQAQYNTLVQRIDGIAQAWDSNNPNCRFQHFFYNLVDPSQVHLYGRPPNAINDALWQKALRENPDPSCYVPALAVGFDDLQKRVEAQKAQTTAHQEKLKELKTRINTLANRHSTANAPRLQRAAAVQTQLQQRLVRLVQHLHLLIPSIRSSSIGPEEEILRSVLENLDEELRRPGGVGRLKGKISELWAMIGAIEAARDRERKNKEPSVEWAIVDPEGMQRLTQILAEQQNGIAHLTKIVQGHQKDLAVILGQPTQEREPDAFSNPQANQVLLGASMRGP
ncbi:nucleoporin nup44 [Pyrrhoderma noxium]|uniref:Nucleoporin nup44 n=1 Tax=Pyrrhoderma noxium TaxID=2282107 RepID=A0A286URN0_9AGAM|nr:nucleoporin nup44 [Pyrrhoderma noxium]